MLSQLAEIGSLLCESHNVGEQTEIPVLYKQLELVHIGDALLTLKAPNSTPLQHYISPMSILGLKPNFYGAIQNSPLCIQTIPHQQAGNWVLGSPEHADRAMNTKQKSHLHHYHLF